MIPISIKKLNTLVDELVGTPFVYGGRDKKVGFDCLGLLLYITKQFGIDLERCLTEEVVRGLYGEKDRFVVAKQTVEASKNNYGITVVNYDTPPQIFDLIGMFWNNETHALMVIPSNRVIHCSSFFGGVTTHTLKSFYKLRSFIVRLEEVTIVP